MVLFDVKVIKCELSKGGKVYIEHSPANEEIKNFIMNGGFFYDLVNNSIEETIKFNKSEIREKLYNNLPDDIRELYSNVQYKISDSYEIPLTIDYDIMGFHKKRVIIFGELRQVGYYRNYDGITYSDLVVEELKEYVRDANGMAQYRIQTINWYLSDDSIGHTKTTNKYYTLGEAIQEGVDRRGNSISEAKAYTLTQLGRNYSFDFLYTVKDYIQFFIDGNTQPLRDAIQASTKPYMTQTIKDGIIETLRMI
jgi:hypothetical protein